MKTKLSLVMSVYNQEKYLKKAIKSIIDQSFKKFEFLILDDGSTDNSWKIIKSFNDPRIKVFRHRQRQGLAKGLNFLIAKTEGEYIGRMDGDDVAYKNRLEKEVGFLDKNPEIALVGSWARIGDQKGRVVGFFKHPTKYIQIRRAILSYNPFVHPTVVFRKKAFKQVGGYNENLFYAQDYDLFLKFVVRYPCANLGQFLLKFRWDPDYKKQKQQHKIGLKIRWKAIKDYGYSKEEVFKLIKPLIFYLVPTAVKKFYWNLRFKAK